MIAMHTENSLYYIDTNNREITRAEGKNPPTPRQGEDGKWKQFHSIYQSPSLDGTRIFIDWDGKGHGTLTSPITDMQVVDA